MSKPMWNGSSRKGDHIEFGQLLGFVDGEMSVAEARIVRDHLEACWSCHVRLEKVREAIADVIEYRDIYTAPHLPPPAAGRTMFLAQLRDLAEKTEQNFSERVSGALRSILRWPSQLPAAGLIALSAGALSVGAVLLALSLWSTSRVSASHLLEQAVQRESGLVGPLKVEHRTIRLEERDEHGTLIATSQIETWSEDSRHARRLFDGRGRMIAGEWVRPDGSHMLFERNEAQHFAASASTPQVTSEDIWRLSPSAEAFAALVGSDASTRASTQVEQQPAQYVLRNGEQHMYGGMHVMRASLTLRRNDLHATEQQVDLERAGHVNNFRMLETAYEQRPAAPTLSSMLEVDAGVAALSQHPALAYSIKPVLPTTVLHASVGLEVEALQRLDQVDAFAKDQIKVERSAEGPLRIEGMVATESRRRSVMAALGPIVANPAVGVRIRTAAEALRQAGNGRHIQVQSVEIDTQERELNPDLQHYFSSTWHVAGKQLGYEIQQYAYQVMDHMEQAQSQALVLRQLTTSLSASDRSELTPQARKQWEQLLRNHAQRVRLEIKSVREDLAPVFYPSGAPSPPATSQVMPIGNAVEQLCQISTSADNVLWKAFSLGSDPVAADRLKTPDFWNSLATAEQLATDLDKTLQQ